ncbi:RiPP maturation radical SAM protein 1 [Pseudohalocynthiibacter aestuariivivens]|nr:RiPP maturation radical SAM C-methyltransferase [Pseudohalocynthiibacter aestuariivivens]QIE45511.1 RiPP maturation radical SAM protein 1 [Pseudohalocynthiibacter aestuariivivens]
MKNTNVAFVNMPLSTTQQPSLGLSLLKAALQEASIDSDIHYLNIWYAEVVGLDILARIEELPTAQLVGESLFVEALWGQGNVDHDGYFEDVLGDRSLDHRNHVNRFMAKEMANDLRDARHCVEAFLDRCVNEIDWGQYKLVGFTSMFQQHFASLALAKRLKEKWPHLHISFGGSNCEAAMGIALLRHFPFVDSVCTGMGDQFFAKFCKDVLNGAPLASYPNIHHRERPIPSTARNVSTSNMDKIPFPDFSDFFFQRVESTPLEQEKMCIMLETSRGCWWGQKHHCTFCGLNGDTLKYSHKSADRALAEFTEIMAQWGHYTRQIAVVDNILPIEYLRTFLPQLKEAGLGIGLFYETKANLTKEQVKLYRDVGLRYIQPGIESLNTDILKGLRKGVSALQNIQLLKWCREYGVKPVWNYLIGIPGETKENYANQPSIINALHHLSSPTMEWIRIDRFSPYHSNPSEFGISNLRPFSAYRYLYPDLKEEDLHSLSYYFVGDFKGKEEAREYADRVEEAIEAWQRNEPSSALFHFASEDALIICDFRSISENPVTVLRGPQRLIYEECDSIKSYEKIKTIASEFLNRDVMDQEIDDWLKPLLDQCLIIEDHKKYVALSVSLENGYFPPEALWSRMERVLTDYPFVFDETVDVPIAAASGVR